MSVDTTQGDIFAMSDDEFENTDPSVFDEPTTDDVTNEDDSEAAEPEAEAADDEPSLEQEEDAEEDSDDDLDEASDEDDSDDDEDIDADDEEDADGELDDAEAGEASDETDYKAEYEKLLAPFKANGREIQAKTPEEARRLMQMGANYNKKMAALKPSLKTVKLLDKHGLNDESKLSHLIDLSRGDKGAIQKLLKDSGVDPMDLDTDEESNYRPNTYTVDDREVELDEVLESLQDSPTYSQTLDLVSNKWDDASKQIIANSPRVLEVLNDQMANGIYERVSTEVERLRAFGQLSGMSDIEAYKTVGDRMADEGHFSDLAGSEAPVNRKPVRRKVAKKPDPKLKQKKRAAAVTRTKPASKQPDDFAPLAMSDEEFEKQFDSNLM